MPASDGQKVKLLVLATTSAPELAVLDNLPKDSWDLLHIGDSLRSFQEKLTSEQIDKVEVLLVCRLIGLPVGGDKDILRELVPALRNLKWIHSCFAGVNSLLVPEIIESPVVVTNAKGVFSSSLAEWALFAMGWFAKDIVQMQATVKRREWDSSFTVGELRGSTLGIVGYGDIGQSTARLAKAFGMKIAALRRRPQLSSEDTLLDKVYPPHELLDLVSASDYVLMATPLTPDTAGLFSEAAIRAMKPTAVFINLGRGSCVDESALALALSEKRIKGAALDVFTVEPLPQDSSLWGLDNVLISPHCADRTREFQNDTVRRFLCEAERYISGEPLQNIVDKKAGY